MKKKVTKVFHGMFHGIFVFQARKGKANLFER
jgi:hypothetical protein